MFTEYYVLLTVKIKFKSTIKRVVDRFQQNCSMEDLRAIVLVVIYKKILILFVLMLLKYLKSPLVEFAFAETTMINQEVN